MNSDHDDDDVFLEAQHACFHAARRAGATIEVLQAIYDLRPVSTDDILSDDADARSPYDRLDALDIESVGGVHTPEPKPKSVRF